MDEELDLTELSMQEGIVIDGDRINGLGIPSGEDLRSNWGMESGCVLFPIRFRGGGKFLFHVNCNMKKNRLGFVCGIPVKFIVLPLHVKDQSLRRNL